MSFRLLTEYHSFLFNGLGGLEYVICLGFRLLTEYHSFLYMFQQLVKILYFSLFPSPYGVSFILIFKKGIDFLLIICYMFPSPYGVSFILISIIIVIYIFLIKKWVSVSLRSIIHSYYLYNEFNKSLMWGNQFPSPYGVSFILIFKDISIINLSISFRLLTEYHSFL